MSTPMPTEPAETDAGREPGGVRRVVTSLVSALVLIAVVAVGVVWYRADHQPSVRFTAMFTGTVGVYPGSDVRMLGVKVGKIDSVTPVGQQVRVRMHLDHGVSAAADTGAVILSPSLVSDRYVQLTGLYTSGPKLADGTVITVNHTATPVELDQLYNSVNQITSALGPNGANAKGALSNLLNTGAANLKGNGQAFNDTLTQLSQATRTLAGNKDDLFATIDNLKDFTGMLAKNNAGVASVNQQLASVSQVLSDDRQSFAAALTSLDSALASVQQFISSNRAKIKSNVDKLATTTQLLVKQRAALSKLLTAAPLAVQNLINAYDPKHNTLNGRLDLNELSLWSDQSSAAAANTAGPPLLLPSGAGK